jgi:glycosyltransferase involved in cell wall biosynthesis
MSRGLNKTRFEHSVLTLNPGGYGPGDEFQTRLRQYAVSGIQVDDLAEQVPDKPWNLPGWLGVAYAKTGILRRARWLAILLRKWNVDVIDARLPSAGLVSVFASKLTGIPACVTVYGGYNNDFQVAWPWTTKLMLRMADCVITDSRAKGDQMRALLGAGKTKVVVIPNGIQVPHSHQTCGQIRQKLGLPADPSVRVIGQIGRLIEYKGHEVLIRAAQIVIAQEPNTFMLLVGYRRTRAYKIQLVELAKRLGIGDRVVITEYAGEIADVWKVIDIHAHASLFDSLPISIAEGMSLAKPAAVTSVGGIPEIVIHQRTGLVVPPGDADQLAQALLKLIREPALAQDLGSRARGRYLEMYQPEGMIRALENEFLAMLRTA